MLGNAMALTQLPFGLIPKIFDAIDVLMLVRKQLAMVHAIVLKLRHIQGIVGTIIDSIDNTIRDDLLPHDGKKRLRFGIRNHFCVDLAPRCKMPKTGTLPAAPRPRLLWRRPPK